MVNIVKTSYRYYTGSGWSENEADAKDFKDEAEAERFIGKHNIDADVISTHAEEKPEEPEEPEAPAKKPAKETR